MTSSPGKQTRPRVGIIGAGLVGHRIAEFLQGRDIDVILCSYQRPTPALVDIPTATGLHGLPDDVSAVILATESKYQPHLARQLVGRGIDVVATADGPSHVARLWELDAHARQHGVVVCVGASCSPGVSTLLVSVLSRAFDDVFAITTAQFGTGGPACAREHHRAMNNAALEVNDGQLKRILPGTGRQLVWFPEPVGAADCFRAGLAEPFLLHHAFPFVPRIESRQAATRRDRLTARLPMLRAPHAEGLVGAVWAEVRGFVGSSVEHRVMAVTGPQATAAAAMAGAAAIEMCRNEVKPGVFSTASFPDPVQMLQTVTGHLGLWTYDGSGSPNSFGIDNPVSSAKKWRIPSKNLAFSPNRQSSSENP